MRGMIMPNEYILMVGPPGAGKSTWINDFLKENDKEWVIISSDNIIMELAEAEGLSYSEGFNQFAKKAMVEMNLRLKNAIKNGDNIIHDQTNMSVKSRAKKLSQAKGYTKKAIVFELMDEELHRRLNKRKNEDGKTIPDHIIKNMLANYTRPSKTEGFTHVHIISS